MKIFNIVLGADTEEARSISANSTRSYFAEWLNQQGHSAEVRISPIDGANQDVSIDGVWVSGDVEASQTLNNLWADYCLSLDRTRHHSS
ncbi:MAG TPA: hypothetical protein EYN93_15345 [Planctomycetaceae bacterium]|nr:hypothetical protein [Planctomycetaceae bacterium]